MKEATHKSKCGKWLYKKSKRAQVKYMQLFMKETPMMFWDAYCNKLRESVMDMKCLNRIKSALDQIE